jgi:hypothetical protein
MKSHVSSHHVLKSLAELSAELLDAKAAAHEKGNQQQFQALAQKNEQLTTRPAYPSAADTRGHRGWGIND